MFVIDATLVLLDVKTRESASVMGTDPGIATPIAATSQMGCRQAITSAPGSWQTHCSLRQVTGHDETPSWEFGGWRTPGAPDLGLAEVEGYDLRHHGADVASACRAGASVTAGVRSRDAARSPIALRVLPCPPPWPSRPPYVRRWRAPRSKLRIGRTLSRSRGPKGGKRAAREHGRWPSDRARPGDATHCTAQTAYPPRLARRCRAATED